MNGSSDAESRSISLHLTWRYVAAFAALTILCGTSHEFAHHFAGAAICGAFGRKTFNSFDLAPGCDGRPGYLWATVAGPLFTFALLWFGAWRLRSSSPAVRQLGFALIFANFPVNRMLFVLLHANDEQWVTTKVYPNSAVANWITVLLVWLACIPPLVVAYRAIANRWRALWFAGFFVLPFVYVVLFAGLFLENYLLLSRHVLATRVVGVPWLIIVVEVLSLTIYAYFRSDIQYLNRRLSGRDAVLSTG